MTMMIAQWILASIPPLTGIRSQCVVVFCVGITQPCNHRTPPGADVQDQRNTKPHQKCWFINISQEEPNLPKGRSFSSWTIHNMPCTQQAWSWDDQNMYRRSGNFHVKNNSRVKFSRFRLIRKIFLMVDGCNMDERLESSWRLVYYQVSGEQGIACCSRRSDIYPGECGLARASFFTVHRRVIYISRVKFSRLDSTAKLF